MKHRILIVAKEIDLCQEIKDSLLAHDLDVDIHCVGDYTQALRHVSRYPYTLIIIGLLFSEANGAAFVHKLRQLDSAPILVLSAHANTAEEVQVLGAGADKYIGTGNPLDIERCLANAQAIMRRHTMPDRNHLSYILISGSGLKINPHQRRAYINGNNLHLTPKQFTLLTSLAQHMGEVVTKEQLYQDAWAFEYELNSDEVLKYHIKELRKKLREQGVDELIETVWGVGYQFNIEDI